MPGSRGLRFRLRSVFVILGVLAVLFAGYGWFHRKFVEPRRHSDAIERHIESLAARRPKDVSPRQWESAVAWTLNLHGNSLLMFQADGPNIRNFEKRLADKLSGDVNLETIHWIWDEYAKICSGGRQYQRFRAQMVDEIQSGGGNWGLKVR